MTSRLDLLNDVLDAMGEPALVSATLTASSPDWAKRADRALTRAEKIIAERHPWNWLTSIELLQETATETPLGWEYEFNKPSYALRIVKVTLDGGWASRPLEYEDRAGLVLSNSETSYLHFVDQRRIALYGAMPEVYAAALGAEAAWRAAMGTTQSGSKKEALDRDRKTALAEAKTWDGQQQPTRPRQPGAFVSAARGAWRSREND